MSEIYGALRYRSRGRCSSGVSPFQVNVTVKHLSYIAPCGIDTLSAVNICNIRPRIRGCIHIRTNAVVRNRSQSLFLAVHCVNMLHCTGVRRVLWIVCERGLSRPAPSDSWYGHRRVQMDPNKIAAWLSSFAGFRFRLGT